MPKETPERKLIDVMQGLSEDYWCAGWMYDLEYVLWSCVLDPQNANFGPCGPLEPNEVDYLTRASREAGGWARWSDPQGITFIELAAWEQEYSRFTENPTNWPKWPGCLIGEEECTGTTDPERSADT